jgi:endonuclease-3
MQEPIVNDIFDILSKEIPNPKTELNYKNPFTLLVAVVLSAQSTDKAVNKVTDSLFQIIKNPQDILDLGIDNLEKYIKSIGLYKTKAKNIYNLSYDLLYKYNGEIKNDKKMLLSLSGVGIKTANVVLNTLFNEETIAVDTHVSRVAMRLNLTKSNNLVIIEQDLLQTIPKKYLQNAHNLLVLHGRYTCKSKKPNCKDCKINHLCFFFNK